MSRSLTDSFLKGRGRVIQGPARIARSALRGFSNSPGFQQQSGGVDYHVSEQLQRVHAVRFPFLSPPAFGQQTASGSDAERGLELAHDREKEQRFVETAGSHGSRHVLLPVLSRIHARIVRERPSERENRCGFWHQDLLHDIKIFSGTLEVGHFESTDRTCDSPRTCRAPEDAGWAYIARKRTSWMLTNG